MKQIHIDRLLKLADHLEYGQLGHKVFDFDSYNLDEHGKPCQARSCGYAGCAIGECPVVFPEEWSFNDYGYPRLNGHGASSAEIFFGISEDAFDHLFIPTGQSTERFGGVFLNRAATKEQVAANIRSFVALKLPTVEQDEK